MGECYQTQQVDDVKLEDLNIVRMIQFYCFNRNNVFLVLSKCGTTGNIDKEEKVY